MGSGRTKAGGSRPRTGYKLLLKARRCGNCGKKLNMQLKRCPQCGKVAGFPTKGRKASG